MNTDLINILIFTDVHGNFSGKGHLFGSGQGVPWKTKPGGFGMPSA